MLEVNGMKRYKAKKSPLVTKRVDGFGNGIGRVVGTFMQVKRKKQVLCYGH